MKIKMVFEVDDSYIKEYMTNNPNKNVLDVRNELSNWGYLSMDCMNAMVMRSMEVGVCDYWVEKTNDKSWGETWGDNFPTETECPIDVIEHHAESYDFPVSDDIISFARAMWNEGNLTEKLS